MELAVLAMPPGTGMYVVLLIAQSRGELVHFPAGVTEQTRGWA
jgi:hypothetical protein